MLKVQRPSFNIKDVRGGMRFSEVRMLPQSEYAKRLTEAFSPVGFFLGTTAVHGLEPQQISVNVALHINNELERNGLPRKPVVLPYVPGHPIYGERNREVLQEVFPNTSEVYLSEELGRMLIQTEFGLAGYQAHWESVRRNQPTVRRELIEFMARPFDAISLHGGEARTFNQQSGDGVQRRIVEINAGANVSAATLDGRITAHSVFPVNLDGLVELVKRHPDIFDYEPSLVGAIDSIAKDLRLKFQTLVLPDLHTLAAESWFEEVFPDAIVTPPIKEILVPPQVRVDTNAHTITIQDAEGNEESAPSYSPDKGIVYINISGSGLGADAAKSFVVKAQEEGYVVAAPAWLKRQWIQQENGKPTHESMLAVLSAAPNLVFAKDESQKPLCKVFFMRAGMGSYAYAQMAGVPMLVLGFEPLENPEMKGNVDVITQNGIGRRYTGRPDSIEQTASLADNLPIFNHKVYADYDIPLGTEGLDFAAQVIIQAEIARLLT